MTRSYPDEIYPLEQDESFELTWEGRFPELPVEEGCPHQPELLIGTRSIKLLSHTSNEAAFEVPFALLFPEGHQPSTFLRVAQCTLRVFRRIRSCFGRLTSFCDKYEPYEFKKRVVLFPTSPGRVIIERYYIKTSIERSKLYSEVYKQSSRQPSTPTKLQKTYTLRAPTGCIIEPNSSGIKAIREGAGPNRNGIPQSSWDRTIETASEVVYTVTTHRYHPENRCDKVSFQIYATLLRPVTTTHAKPQQETVLTWKTFLSLLAAPESNPEKKILPPRVIFHCFDGTTCMLDSSSKNPYVKVTDKAISAITQSFKVFKIAPTTNPKAPLRSHL